MIFYLYGVQRYQMKKLFFYAPFILVLSACHSKPVKKVVVDSVAVYKVPEEKAIDKAVLDAYNCIGFKMGEQPRYEGIKKFFIPQAQLINFRSDSAQITNINQFIYLYRTFVETDDVKAFSEKELYGKTEQFGRVAERISNYKSEIINSDTTIERGINSFQLIKTNNGWKVSSIIWDVESPNLRIPAYYWGKLNPDSLAKKKVKVKRWISARQQQSQ